MGTAPMHVFQNPGEKRRKSLVAFGTSEITRFPETFHIPAATAANHGFAGRRIIRPNSGRHFVSQVEKHLRKIETLKFRFRFRFFRGTGGTKMKGFLLAFHDLLNMDRRFVFFAVLTKHPNLPAG